MLAYNGSIPGPTLKVPQGSTITVHVTNHGDLDATVHWHGLRLENRYDGTHETQAPIPVGGTFTYQVTLPDPGVYWYHPHIREDYGQEMGLYGNILVDPDEPDYWPPANRELLLTLDDVLIEDGRVAAFSESETTHVAMGRFGNVMLVAGEPTSTLEAKRGEVVRFYLTNTANTRVFNVTLPGAQMKLVGGDSGHYEHEALVDEVLLSPSERVVVDVLFDRRRGPRARAPNAGAHLPARHDRRRRRAGGALPTGRVRAPADESRHGRAERERIAPFLERRPTRRSPSWPRWTWACPKGPGRLRLPDASRGRQRGARTAARSAA